jgi:hypothetical protein
MPQLLEVMERWDGFNPVSAVRINEAGAARLLNLISNRDRLPAHRQEYLLREAITTSDFPALFGFVLEQDIIARYRAVVAPWRAYTKVGTLPNFNLARAHKVIGNDGLLPAVAERAPYPEQVVASGFYTRQLAKYGGQFDLSWESVVNDALGAFSDIPQRFADAALYTEAFNVTSLYAAAAGPNPLLFGAPIADAADGANVTNVGALPLTIANLETTIGLMAAQRDAQGKPLGIRAAHLVVPPMLELTARAILTSAVREWIPAAAAPATVPMPAANVLPQMGLQLHVDPLLPVIDLSGNGNGTWYLFAEPSRIAAIQLDYLRGYEQPEIVMKASDKVTTGGTAISPFAGDFATDDIIYRVRHVMGGSRLDPRGAYAQVSV